MSTTRPIRVRRVLPFLVLLGFTVPCRVSAQGVKLAIGPRFGTSGIGGEVSAGFSRVLAVRGAFTTLSVTLQDKEIQGITYDITPRSRSVKALLDVHPFSSAFRLTGGAVFNQSRALAVADLSNGVFLGASDYAPNQLSRLTGEVRPKKTSMYVGYGFGGARPARVSFSFDMGVIFQGRPRATLAASSTSSGPVSGTQLAHDLELERAQVQQKIDDLPGVVEFYPVLDLGLKFGL